MNDLTIIYAGDTAVTLDPIGADPLAHFDRLLARQNLAASTVYRYRREVVLAHRAGVNLLDATAVSDYAATIPSSRKMFLRAGVGLIAGDMVQAAKANVTPGNVALMQAVMWRAESLRDSINVKHTAGQRAHTWLNLAEVRTLVNLPKVTDRAGLRDKVLLGLLVGAGLRREEAATLAWSDIVRADGRTILNITGKGDKTRPIPVSQALAGLLADWAAVIGSDGRILRNVDQVGRVGESMSGQAILDTVQRYGRAIGYPGLRPHDLRRTYARIGYDAGIDIGQVSLLLGHADIKTTQRYLGLAIDTRETISDFVPLA